jgi:hypothetical protein
MWEDEQGDVQHYTQKDQKEHVLVRQHAGKATAAHLSGLQAGECPHARGSAELGCLARRISRTVPPPSCSQTPPCSWGNGCGQDGAPGVYTRVATYTGWISEKLGQVDKLHGFHEFHAHICVCAHARE